MRVGKFALIYQRRTIRDITRQIAGEKSSLKPVFARLLHLAGRVLQQNRHQRGPKSGHAEHQDLARK